MLCCYHKLPPATEAMGISPRPQVTGNRIHCDLMVLELIGLTARRQDHRLTLKHRSLADHALAI